MELLHSIEEIRLFDRKGDLMMNLSALTLQFSDIKTPEIDEIKGIVKKLDEEIKIELAKYESYIGKECLAPPSQYTNSQSKELRPGKIIGKFYFNYFSKSVRCEFRYATGGFDSHAIRELIEI